ncbi:MAG TPA: CoA transferase [Quisquiliibacterium sp.]|nr:MAG: CoA transferase [Burkholderiaceae bacterium]HPA89352.1 CoA transferase [Quisquiliibacterium sp.]HQN13232.1 CoA transferase [Quisquiliibacterium sp.]
MSYDAPFAGLKVVDLSQGIAGPYCAMLLAQHGAQVIKVENAGEGDWSRVLGARYGDHTAFSIIGNLGKRSVAIDLKGEQGKAVLWRLLRGADVFLEGFRPGVIRRLGFDYEAVSAREPRLLYLSISGFGQTGPLSERPAMDPVLQAFAGLTAENKGEDGIPHRVPVIPVDMCTALYAYQALSSALYARRDETRGRYIDVSLLQGAAGLQAIRMMASTLEGGTVRPGGVPYGVYRTADGWMTVTAIHDREWRDLCAAIERPDLAEDPRFADPASRYQNEVALNAVLRPLLETRDFAEWSRRFTRAKLLHERVNRYADFLKEPQVAATGAVAWLDQPGVSQAVPVPNVPGTAPAENGTPRSTSPACGQHTREVLREHGYADAEIDALVAQGVVGEAV